MIQSIELQMISKILTSEDEAEVDALCNFDTSYYSVYKKQIEFILDHRDKYGTVPDVFTFQAEFVDDDITLIDVNEPVEFLIENIKKNKQYIIFLETFNKIQELSTGDITEAWEYIGNQYENAMKLSTIQPMNIISQAEERANNIIEFSKQTRIPTGFPEIDKLMYGGLSTVEELLLLVARTNTGKAQPLWSKVLTPTGWTTMGELKAGDLVVGENNDNGRVVKLFPQGVKDYYRVNFDDGTSVECCDDHLWKVLDSSRRQRDNENYEKHEVLTLKEIRHNLDKKYSVDITAPIEFDVPFDVEAQEAANAMCRFLEECEDESYKNLFRADHDFSGSLISKSATDFHVPDYFLTAPTAIREKLFNAIVRCSRDCRISSNLINVAVNLARSLGLKVGSLHGAYKLFHRSTFRRYCKIITSVEYVGKTECQCILLDNKTHTYITDGYTVTHNSWIMTKMSEAAQKNGFPVAFYSPEMRAEYLSTRFDSWRGHFKNSDLFLGRYTQEYWDYIYSLQQEETAVYVIEDKDMPDGVTTRSLGSFVKRHNIKLLIVDGLSYMSDCRKSSRDYEKYKHICEDLFMLSKKYGCAVVVTAQANRETKDTLDDKGEPFPSLYQVSDSDAPARIATQAFAVRQIFDQHVLDIRLEKSRNAKNERPVYSYSWDVNTGNMQYIPSEESIDPGPMSSPAISPGQILGNVSGPADTSGLSMEDLEDEDVEF